MRWTKRGKIWFGICYLTGTIFAFGLIPFMQFPLPTIIQCSLYATGYFGAEKME